MLALMLIPLGAMLAFVGALSALIVFDAPPSGTSGDGTLNFAALRPVAAASLPEPVLFQARDGTNLPVRLYGDRMRPRHIVILLHGSGWHGAQFQRLATGLAATGGTLIAVPDLRGHGLNPAKRGDIGYVGQFEDDLADLIGILRRDGARAEVIVAGHSSGGGLALRLAGGQHGGLVDRFVFLAPFLGHDAATTRPRSGGWARPAVRRIIGLTMLNRLGIHWFDHLPVISFAFPATVLGGPMGHTATTRYSHRLNASYAPRNLHADLAALRQPYLVLAGTKDEAFHAAQYEGTMRPHAPQGRFVLLDGAGHLDLVDDPRTADAMVHWIEGRGARARLP